MEAMAFALVIGSLSGIFRAGYNLCCCVCAILLNVSQLFPNSINLMHCVPWCSKGSLLREDIYLGMVGHNSYDTRKFKLIQILTTSTFECIVSEYR